MRPFLARTVALLALLIAAHVAEAQPQAEQLFERAADAIGEGDSEHAATLLEQAARSATDPRIASETLFLLGELYEERLDRPTDASATYRKLQRLYPQSRVAIAAAGRLEVLETMLGSGADDEDSKRLGRFLAIRRNAVEGDANASLLQAEALLTEDAEWPSAPQVRLWMAGVALRDGQRERAETLYLKAIDSNDADVQFEARLGAANLVKERGDYDAARSLAEGIDPGAAPGRVQAKREALKSIEAARGRAGLASYAKALLVLIPVLWIVLIGWRKRSLRGALRALWPPPGEAIYLAPVLAVFIAAAFTGHVPIAWAVLTVAIAGIATTWLSGSVLRELPRSWPTAIGVAVTAALVVTCALFLALHRGGLIDLMISTLRFGPDV